MNVIQRASSLSADIATFLPLSAQYLPEKLEDDYRPGAKKPREDLHTISGFSLLIHISKSGQGGAADAQPETRDLRAELLKAEAAHFAKLKGGPGPSNADAEPSIPKRQLESAPEQDDIADEDPEAKRRRILEETRDIDADSDGGDSDSSEEDSDDEEDETAELMRELEKIKRERAEQREREEQEQAAKEQEKREIEIARGNPLLNPQDFNIKRRWDDDVIFKNQARGTENKGDKEFVN
ncbi:hypothetical protein TRV_06583, partial [Trichophyton verrucosum HKI 0517]